MRSLSVVREASRPTVRALLEEAATLASSAELSADDALEAPGHAARVEALLRARHAALAAVPAASGPAAVVLDGPGYLDAQEAANHLGVSRSTVLRLSRAGKLATCRPSPGAV